MKFSRLKPAFDAQGIETPSPHLILYAGQDKQGNAPELPLRLAPGEPAAAA